ncbi:hypothetical protein ACJ6WE_38640 [Streptomyces sp. MMS24-I31]
MFINPYWVFAGTMFLVSCISVVVIFVGVRQEMKREGRDTK